MYKMQEPTNRPHFHVSAGIIWKDGKVLVTKRPHGSHLEGLWEFPGGKKEQGESLRECLAREIKEELGLTVEAEEAILTVVHDYGTKQVSLHFFQCRPLSGEPKPLQSDEMRWVRPKDLRLLSFPPPDRAMIDWLVSNPAPVI